MRANNRFRSIFAASLALVLLGACGDKDGDGNDPATKANATFAQSEATTVAKYKLVDFAFDGPVTVEGPKVFFIATNQGTQNHELEVLDSSGEAIGEIPSFSVGASSEPLAAVLTPGTYTLQCILETPEGQVHKDLGMATTLTVE